MITVTFKKTNITTDEKETTFFSFASLNEALAYADYIEFSSNGMLKVEVIKSEDYSLGEF